MTATPAQLPPMAAIARDILRLGVSGRLPTTLEYQARLGVGSGTVQKAIRQLRDDGAVQLRSRGHQGTFVTGTDPVRLWQHALMAPVHLLLPPSGPAESLAVAAGLAEAFAAIGAGTTVGYLRGARSRLAAVDAAEADVAIMSAGGAGATGPEHTVLHLGPGSYYAPGSLVVVGRAGAGPVRRVGIDPRSSDHQRLTRAEFGDGTVEYVRTDFTRIPRAVLAGDIDTGVWHTVDSLIPLDLVGLRTDALRSAAAQELEREISGAVLAARTDTVVGALLGRMDADDLRTAADRAHRAGAEALEARLRVSIH